MSPILCGGAFLERNLIVQELKDKRIKVANKHYIMESSPFCPPVADMVVRPVSVARTTSIAPGEYCDLQIPPNFPRDREFILSPHPSSLTNPHWAPQTVIAVGNTVKFQNTTPTYLEINRNTPVLQISPTKPMHHFTSDHQSTGRRADPPAPNDESKQGRDGILTSIHIRDDLPTKLKNKLFSIHSDHLKTFNGDLRNGYNGLSGDHTVNFNFKNGIPPPIHFGCVPSYTKREDNVLMQAMIDRLEDLNIVIKANDAGIIPKFASPTLLVLKNSARTIPSSEYNKLSVAEKLKLNRFVLCQNKLNEYVEKVPHQYATIEDTIRMVGSYEFVITTDLTDSFWQRPICKSKLPYMAFHSPFRGTYLFLRSSQGFLNQSEGLENMIRCVLQDCVAEGWCRIHADNIYILGHTAEETIERWKVALDALQRNNLKLSPKKTLCFPKKLDLLGWTKEGKFLLPDKHRQQCLSIAEIPKTAKQLRSFIGGYRQFQKCQPNTAFILKGMEEFLSKHKVSSSQKLEWTDQLRKEFDLSKEKIKHLDKLYLPKPDDQLVLTTDWCKSGVSGTLWAVVDDVFRVVARMSTRTDRNMENMMPCDGETCAVYIAAKCATFSLPIKAANKRTICLVDNKTSCQAAKLLQQGKFSTSRIINQLLSSISELNLEFQHLSGKMGQNFTDDFGSRNPVSCPGGEHCKVCSFVADCSKLSNNSSIFFSVGSMSIIASIESMGKPESNELVNNIIKGTTNIPFGNRQAMKYLQEQDPDLQWVRNELTSGQRPQNKNTKINSIKRYLQRDANITIAKDGCLVSSRLGKKFAKKELIVIPKGISTGLLYGMHLNLNHPTPFQLRRVVDTKFFMLDRDKIIKEIWSSCALCQSVKQIPSEIEDFKANQVPDHPGKEFTVDIMKHSKSLITVATDNFSGFISTCFIKSEDHSQLLEGIIQTITPFKASSLSRIRVDQAPGFQKLMKKKADLDDLGIELEPGEAKNKNAVALVDRKMSELRAEIKKLAPSNNVINVRILSKATASVNEKVRSSGFSSKEILFSRDQFTQENIALEDEVLAEETMLKRAKDNVNTARAKATTKRPSTSANASKGQLVFLKRDGSKTHRRDLYLVLEADKEQETVIVSKLLHTMSNLTPTMQPQNIRYKLKQSDIFLAPNQPIQADAEFIPHFSDAEFIPRLPGPPPPPYTSRPADNFYQHNPGIYYEESDCSEYEDDDYDSDEEGDTNGDYEQNTSDDENVSNDDSEDFSEPENSRDTDVITLDDTPPNQQQPAVEKQDEPHGPDEEQDEPHGSDEENHPNRPDSYHPDPPLNMGEILVYQEEPQHPVWGDLQDLSLNPPLPPLADAVIVYFHPESQQTRRAKMMKTFKTMQRKYPGWFNLTNDGDRKPISVNLSITRWQYIHPPPPHNSIPQVDGNYTLQQSPTVTERAPLDSYHDPLRTFQLSQEMNLFIPTLPADGNFTNNQRYRLPLNVTQGTSPLTRSRIASLSEGDLTNSDSSRPSRWTRRIRNFRNVLRNIFKK